VTFTTVLKWALGAFAVLVLLGLVLAVLFIVLSSTASHYEDVSDDPEHASRIGERCIVLKGLRAHGVYNVDGTRGVTDHVTVTTLPGFSGYEVTFTADIPKGTAMVVIGVRKCSNCPFENRIEYALSIPDVPRLAGYKVFARAATLEPDEVRCTMMRP
jgi:hypothetical protein